MMKKSDAIRVFGSIANLARILGTSHTAVQKWPETLPRRLEDRVIAAAVREHSEEKLVAVMALMTALGDDDVPDDDSQDDVPDPGDPEPESVIDTLVQADDARDILRKTLLSRS